MTDRRIQDVKIPVNDDILQLENYISHVQRTILSAPDEHTRMIRSYILALAEAYLKQLVEQSNTVNTFKVQENNKATKEKHQFFAVV